MTHPVDDLVAELRPDEYTGAAYQRRREADLARAFATPRRAPRWTDRFATPYRRTGLALAGGALAMAVAATVTLSATMSATAGGAGPLGGQDARPGVTSSISTAADDARNAPSPIRLEPRAFLLAGAETVLREQPADGRYRYERTRTFEPVDRYGALVAHTDESWYDGRGGRTSSNQDVEVVFDSAGDKARWQAAGSPSLWSGKPSTDDFSKISLSWSIGRKSLTMNQLHTLPETAAGLEKWLRQAHTGGSFPDFVFGAARYLLSSPASAETRAAALRVLADQPGLTLSENVADRLGRTGVAIDSPDGAARLIVDRSGSTLLAYVQLVTERPVREPGPREVRILHAAGYQAAYEAMGWTREVGTRP